MTHPLHVFQEAGYEVDLVSTAGGALQMDSYSDPTDASGYSAHDVISLGYMQQPWFKAMLANTRKLTEVQPDEYDAIFLVGGQGPMYTYRGNAEMERLFVNFYEAGKPAAAVCHSTTLLLEAKKSDGELLVAEAFLPAEFTDFTDLLAPARPLPTDRQGRNSGDYMTFWVVAAGSKVHATLGKRAAAAIAAGAVRQQGDMSHEDCSFGSQNHREHPGAQVDASGA